MGGEITPSRVHFCFCLSNTEISSLTEVQLISSFVSGCFVLLGGTPLALLLELLLTTTVLAAVVAVVVVVVVVLPSTLPPSSMRSFRLAPKKHPPFQSRGAKAGQEESKSKKRRMGGWADGTGKRN